MPLHVTPAHLKNLTQRGQIPGQGNAEWKGDPRSGTGAFTAGDTIEGQYSFKSRFEDGRRSQPGGADRGGARVVLLNGALQRARRGRHAGRVGQDRTPSSRSGSSTGRLPSASITLTTVGGVPTLDKRSASCPPPPGREAELPPVSKALAGVPEIHARGVAGLSAAKAGCPRANGSRAHAEQARGRLLVVCRTTDGRRSWTARASCGFRLADRPGTAGLSVVH